MISLQLLQHPSRQIAFRIPGIQYAGGLEQQDAHLFLRHRAVLHAARDDQEFVFGQFYLAVPELHCETAFDDQEHFILVVVLVPHEFALELDQLDFLAVQFAYDPGIPVVVEKAEFLREVDFFHTDIAVLRTWFRSKSLKLSYSCTKCNMEYSSFFARFVPVSDVKTQLMGIGQNDIRQTVAVDVPGNDVIGLIALATDGLPLKMTVSCVQI